jgi:hypothetical protein
VSGSCKYGNESLGCIKDGKILDQLIDVSFSRTTVLQGGLSVFCSGPGSPLQVPVLVGSQIEIHQIEK